ncbi:unnamed protein product, partial [Amoebophrya sp. A120]
SVAQIQAGPNEYPVGSPLCGEGGRRHGEDEMCDGIGATTRRMFYLGADLSNVHRACMHTPPPPTLPG